MGDLLAIGVDPGTSSAAAVLVDWTDHDTPRLVRGVARVDGGWLGYAEGGWYVIDGPLALDLHADRTARCAVEAVTFFARAPGKQDGRVGGSQLVALADSGGWWHGVLEGQGGRVVRPQARIWRAQVLGLRAQTPAAQAEQAALDACIARRVPLPAGPRGGLGRCGHIAEAVCLSAFAAGVVLR
jgi:hypothetical protein